MGIAGSLFSPSSAVDNSMMIRPAVIKYGGSLLEDPAHRSQFLEQVARLSKTQRIVLVHGGGKEITRQMENAGLEAKFIKGRRFTDEKTMEFVQSVLAKLNAEIVRELRSFQADAKGFSGQERHLLEATPVPELGRVGYPRSVDPAVLQDILREAALPVFYSVADDIALKPLNINADDFALALAVTCRAKRLVFLTDTGGIAGADGKIIDYITPQESEKLIASNVISSGMIVKAQACVRALQEGVGRVDIVKDISYLDSIDSAPKDGTVFLPGPEIRN